MTRQLPIRRQGSVITPSEPANSAGRVGVCDKFYRPTSWRKEVLRRVNYEFASTLED